jgi:hypothetical protein
MKRTTLKDPAFWPFLLIFLAIGFCIIMAFYMAMERHHPRHEMIGPYTQNERVNDGK